MNKIIEKMLWIAECTSKMTLHKYRWVKFIDVLCQRYNGNRSTLMLLLVSHLTLTRHPMANKLDSLAVSSQDTWWRTIFHWIHTYPWFWCLCTFSISKATSYLHCGFFCLTFSTNFILTLNNFPSTFCLWSFCSIALVCDWSTNSPTPWITYHIALSTCHSIIAHFWITCVCTAIGVLFDCVTTVMEKIAMQRVSIVFTGLRSINNIPISSYIAWNTIRGIFTWFRLM